MIGVEDNPGLRTLANYGWAALANSRTGHERGQFRMVRRTKASNQTRAEPDEFLLALGGRIRQARTQAGLSGQQLATAASTTKTWVYAVEDGKQNVTIQGLRRLLRALNLEIQDILPPGPDLATETVRIQRLHQASSVLILQLTPLLEALRELQALTASSHQRESQVE